MNFDFAQNNLAMVIRQRNLALGSCVASSLASVILALGLYHHEERWILMPQFQEDHKLEVTRSKHSDQYLIDWATGILNTIKCANADSIDWKIHQILKISSSHGVLKEQLTAEANRIKKDKISTAFYPASFRINQAARTMEVQGEHSAWFGGDAVPILTPRRYRLTWAIRPHGVILLDNFIDITRENKAHDKKTS